MSLESHKCVGYIYSHDAVPERGPAPLAPGVHGEPEVVWRSVQPVGAPLLPVPLATQPDVEALDSRDIILLSQLF